ncbi:MAG: hypothetical protein Q8K24_15330 [Hydrogenophaga sp.]|nr:hypothetical protein [Hydrogenophaga sp.]
MGIWIELGIFVVVLAWGFWQLHDVKKELARTRAENARQAELAVADQRPGGPDPAQGNSP